MDKPKVDEKLKATYEPPQLTDSLCRANIAHDLPISASLIMHYHENAGFPIKETWCKVIASGNYATWPGLTVELGRWYCPDADETMIGTMSQKRKKHSIK